MRILVWGAGPVGSVLAARLQEGGQGVSVLARGQRLADLRLHGLVLEDALTGSRSTYAVSVVESLEPDDAYDLVLVVMRKNQVAGTLPALAANRCTPNVLFLGNNAAGPAEYVAALGAERVMMGFGMAAGLRQGHVMRVLGGGAQPMILPLGEANGQVTDRTLQVAVILRSMPGYDVEIRADIDAWLKTHVALLMPSLAPALYACALDRFRAARTRDTVVLAVRAIREGFQVLRALGVPIVPARIQRLAWVPEPLAVAMFQRAAQREVMEVAMIGHLRAAPDEMKHLADEFLALARQTTVPTPAIDRLYAHLDPATPHLPDGSAEIPLAWRELALPLAALAALIAAGYALARAIRH